MKYTEDEQFYIIDDLEDDIDTMECYYSFASDIDECDEGSYLIHMCDFDEPIQSVEYNDIKITLNFNNNEYNSVVKLDDGRISNYRYNNLLELLSSIAIFNDSCFNDLKTYLHSLNR